MRDDAAMDTLEQGLKSLQLTPDSGQGLMVQLQQLLVQHQPPLQPVLEHDQHVLQQLETLLQKTPLAENKMKDSLDALSSLTNLFKTPNPPQPSNVQEPVNPPHAQVTAAPALDGLDKIARTHVADNQPYLQASNPQSSYTGPTISDIRQDKTTQEKVSLVVDAIKNISPVFGQPSSGIPTLPGISPLDQLKQHLAGNTGTFLPGVPNTPSPSQPQPLNVLEQLRSLLLPGTPPQPPQVLLQPVPPQPQDLLQQLKELLIPQPTPQPVVQQLQDPLQELRNILLQQLPTAPPPLYAQHPVYVPQQPTLLPHQVPVPHQSPQTSQLAQLLSSLQGVSTTARSSLQQMSATQPQPRMLPQAQSLPQPHQMTLQQLLQHPEILQQLSCSLNQPSTTQTITQHGLLEPPKQQQSQPKQQQPQHSQLTGLQGMSQVRPVHVRPTEYSRYCQVDYSDKIKPENANLVMFCYGYIGQILASRQGHIARMSESELDGRLQHLLHLLELTAMFSSNADYSAYSWHRARNYNARIFSDLDHGNISWPDITNKMDPTSMMQAIEAIPKEVKEKKKEERKPLTQKTEDGPPCSRWNSCDVSGKCSYEVENPGKTCNRPHICSYCFSKFGHTKTNHKESACRKKEETDSGQPTR